MPEAVIPSIQWSLNPINAPINPQAKTAAELFALLFVGALSSPEPSSRIFQIRASGFDGNPIAVQALPAPKNNGILYLSLNCLPASDGTGRDLSISIVPAEGPPIFSGIELLPGERMRRMYLSFDGSKIGGNPYDYYQLTEERRYDREKEERNAFGIGILPETPIDALRTLIKIGEQLTAFLNVPQLGFCIPAVQFEEEPSNIVPFRSYL